MNYTAQTTCLICSNSIYQSEMVGYEKFYLSKCKKCSFVFTYRIPTENELTEFYSNYGRADYLSPVTIKRYNELLDKMESFRKTNKLLDVGCGIGYFLVEAKKRGWEVYGTEFTDEAVQICAEKGINMKKGTIHQVDLEKNSFDVITSFEVLEHLNTPFEEVKTYHQLLRNGGLFYLTTPNFNSLLRRKLKHNHEDICYPEHLSYFTPKTMRFMLKNAQFQVKKVETTGFSYSKFKNGNIAPELRETNIQAHSSDEKLRNLSENNTFLTYIKHILNFILTISALGDSLKVWSIKK